MNENKIYDIWNNKKKNISENNIHFKEKDIWWCKLGKNIGQEQNGVGQNFSRPVIIFRKLDNKTCIILPLTTKEHVGSWFFELVNYDNKKSWVLLNQIRLVSSRRLYLYVGNVSNNNFDNIKELLTSLLKLN
jgi:mRNA interferase MazF